MIEETDVINHWTSIGATINLVGSLKTGLMINNRDIDFHIYTNPFNRSEGFLAVSTCGKPELKLGRTPQSRPVLPSSG